MFKQFLAFLFIGSVTKQCGALPIQDPKGACVLRTHEMMDPLRMLGPDIISSEFENTLGSQFSIRFIAGQQYRYRFINKVKVECYNIDGDIPIPAQEADPMGDTYQNLYNPTAHIRPGYGYSYPPGLMPESPEMMLVCHQCKIPTLTSNTTNSLESKQKFMYLDFVGSKMTKIDQNALDSFTELTALNLEDNLLSSLPDQLFSKQLFQAGLQMSLRNNMLENVSQTFCHVKEIEFLNLQDNHIRSMDVDCKIKVLNLNMSNNNIVRMDLNWLENYDRLVLLDLSFNGMRELVNVEESNLESLKYLYVDNNRLAKVGRRYFRRFTTLESLTLRKNAITSIDSEAFKDLKTLQNLDLSDNAISDMPFGIFRDLEVLKELNIAGNNIKKLTMQTFSGLTELKFLNLSSNLLQHIASTDLLQIKQLQAIDLSNNRMQKLDAEALMSQHSITWMAIKNNFWNCRQLLQILQFVKGKGCNVKRGVLYDVPNIHGIACTTKNVTLPENLEFDGFLDKLSDEKEMELILSKLDSVDDFVETKEVEIILSNIKSLILLIAVLFCVDFIFQWLFRLYQARHTINIPISTLK